MNLCRCGHGRHVHQATANAFALARHSHRQPQAGCRFSTGRFQGRKVCPCRNFVEERNVKP